ncbi:MAG: DNA polymerase I [Proteobacteria bacterium]|nr:DNA polymerase I [Pseudomonadota bacterium]
MPKKLFLIDGSNHAFRVFHAMPRNMFAAGFPTGALLGFANMLRKLEREYAPDWIVCCFDNGPSFRQDLYPEYKGHRPNMPDELREQWPHFKELVEAWGHTFLNPTGVEADDVIGTLAAQLASDEIDVTMVTGDKDFYQLVTDKTLILDVMKDKVIDIEGVKEKFGVGPERVIDIQGLAGDSSDNVPGVPGVGVKTAINYVTAHGDMEGVIAAATAGKIGGKRGASVVEFAEQARLSRVLVTIKLDCELGIGLEDLEGTERDVKALRQLFMQWQFRTHLKELQEDEATAQSEIDPDIYKTIGSPLELEEVLAAIEEARLDQTGIALTIDADGADLMTAKWTGIGLTWGTRAAVYVPIGPHVSGDGTLFGTVRLDTLDLADAVRLLKPMLEDPRLRKTGHRLKTARRVFAQHGITLRGQAGDVLLADYLLEPARTNRTLEDLALRYLGHTMKVTPDVPLHMRAESAHVCWLLEGVLIERLDENKQLGVYHDIELPLVGVLAEMEDHGIGVDPQALRSMSAELVTRLAEIEASITALMGRPIKINSPKELQVVLFDELGLEPLKKTKTGFSTDAATLEKLAQVHELPKLIVEWRKLEKLRGTYLDALPEYISEKTGRIHTNLNQAVAATGRLSSADPNLQNIPIRTPEGRRIRECFVANEGHVFVSCDYSQIELRLLAHFCGDGALFDAFEKGQDIHQRTASEVFATPLDEVTREQRSAAKAINFGLIYGMAAPRLASDLNISREQAQDYIDTYFEQYPEVKAYMDTRIERAREEGHSSTLWGRRRTITHLNSRNFFDRSASERLAINTPIQGSAADLIKLAMVRVARRLSAEAPTTRMLLQVHDELLFEVPEADADRVTELVREEMEGIAPVSVDLRVESGRARTWDGAH